MTMYGCAECRAHFQLLDTVKHTDDHFICNYHTDYTGRADQKDRLQSEWMAAGDKAVEALANS
jgi:hypothetical protein